MTIPSNLFTVAFREHRLGFMFVLLTVALVYLATLAIAAQSGLAALSSGWSRNVQGRMTVEIPFPDDAKTQKERVKKITEGLRALPEIAEVSPVPDSEVARLLKPWFSESSRLASLPLPSLIDIETKEADSLSSSALHEKLSLLVSDARVVSRAEGLDGLLNLVRSLRLLAAFMIFLTALTLVIAITLICRAAMAVQHDTIELLHFMGATDSDIARQFLHHIRRLSLPASLLGFAGAVASVFVLLYLLHNAWGQPLTFDRAWAVPGVMMTLVPVTAVLVAMAGARVAVLSLLRRMI